MLLERIESNKLQLEPWRDAAGLHVDVNLENYDGSWSTVPNSPILLDDVVWQLQRLFGKSAENVREIKAQLSAGRWVLIDGRCAHRQLVNAGFAEQ
jgi:hypothetical protein